jgi:hypothetical protein
MTTPQQASTMFAALYRKWYGRQRFICPILAVLVVAAIENFYLAKELIRIVEATGTVTLAVTPAAIAGAYTFVAWDFFDRAQRRDLSTADILRGALRLAIALPLGFALSALTQEGSVFLAFAIGVFPLNTISVILRQLANKKLNLEIGAAETHAQVAQLSGVDSSIADRIAEADVTTIAQLAWCDPIQLTMRTNLSFSYVIDIVSQALAWVYLESKLDALRPFGLRGAFEIRVLLCEDLKSSDPNTRAEANAVLPSAAAAVGMPLPGLMYAFDQMANDRATDFLYEAS